MRIHLVTPAKRGSRAGNRTTADRWARHLRAAGHRVAVAGGWAGEPCDLLIVLHAWRRAEAAERFRAAHPEKPLIVALGGTDLYHFLFEDPETTTATLARADRIVALHDRAHQTLPTRFHDRLVCIPQSADPLPRPRQPVKRSFRACVIGHLRYEKDPLRAALAARQAPHDSRLHVLHLGKAYDESWAEAARAERAENARYTWRGERSHAEVRQLLATAHLLVLPSRAEGGPNVISEAAVAGLPVIGSRIEAMEGLLGNDYPGLFPVEDTNALAQLLTRAEREPPFYQTLERAIAERAPRFRPEREAEAWAKLIEEVATEKASR
jgi:putative glycosyltransferase (TIGR04348 family)